MERTRDRYSVAMIPAVIISPVANLRHGPSHKSELLTQCLMGEEISILQTSGQWSRVKSLKDNYKGWMENGSFQICTRKESQAFEQNSNQVQQFEATLLEKPSSGSQPIFHLVVGSRLKIIEKSGVFFKVATFAGEMGFVSANAFKPFLPEPFDAKLRAIAFRCLGIHYLWGGTTPKGLDCSGFVQLVMRECGIKMSRDAHQQSKQGRKLAGLKHSRLGDLLFFGTKAGIKSKVTHVAIALGDNLYIHASSFVRINSLDPDHSLYNSYRRKTFLFARRVSDQM